MSITNSQSPPKPMSIESMMPSNHLILCHPLLLLPSIFSSIRVFSDESALHIRWPKYWSFSFNISPSNEHPGLISFRMDRVSRRKEILKIRAEINAKETKETIAKINKAKSWFFRMDWLDLLEVQGTLKSLLQHHSSKALILQHSAFFIVQLSHPYMTTGKIVALTRWTFVGKVMSLLSNMLSQLVMTFPSKE